MNFCTNCKQEIIDGVNFCTNCGAEVNSENATVRDETIFEEKIQKCPKCGDPIDPFETVCDACGYVFQQKKATSSIDELQKKLSTLYAKRPREKKVFEYNRLNNVDEEIINLIKNFPIPNTKEDILEFMILSSSNIDTSLTEGFGATKTDISISNAWESKMQQAYQKAKISCSQTNEFQNIQNIYENKKKKIQRQKARPLYFIFGSFACIFFMFIFIILELSIFEMGDKQEIKRLEKIVVEIENALEEKDYKFALMNADILSFQELNSDLKKEWEIKRDYWIDKVIEEASNAGITLERPKEKIQSDPEENLKNNGELEQTQEIFKNNANTNDDFDEKISPQLKVTEESMDNCTFLIIENPTEYDLSISCNAKFFNEFDKLVGVASKKISAFERGTKTIMIFSNNEEYKYMDYEFKVEKEEYYSCVVSALKCESISAKEKEIVSLTNEGTVPADFVEVYTLFFKDEKIVDYDWAYFTDEDSEIKPGETITEEIYSYEEYDSVEFYFIGRADKNNQ